MLHLWRPPFGLRDRKTDESGDTCGALEKVDMVEMLDKTEHVALRIAERIEPSAPLMGDDDDLTSAAKLHRPARTFLLVDGKAHLLEDGSTASVTIVPPPSESDYDPNGFYLSDGPNSARAARRARIEQMLQDDGDNSDVTWF